MMENVKNVPALRFPEFADNWTEKTLGSLSKGVLYGMNSSAIEFDGENKYIRITDIDEVTRQFTPRPLTSPDGIIEDRYKLKDGDIVFARTGAGVGRSYLYRKSDGNLLYAGFLIKFSIIDADPYFVYAHTFRGQYHQWVKLMSMRSGQPGINAEEYKQFSFYLPSLPEQQKIASFLIAVDDKIQQLNKKKALLEQYKKGVMQQLFSQQLRFKDDQGNAYPDWEEKTLGDLVEFITTNSYSRSMLNYDDGTVRNIHYGDIHTKFKSQFRLENELVPYLNSSLDVSKIAQETYCREGDLVIADASEDYKDVGKAIEIMSTGNEKLVAGLHTYIARDKRPDSTAIGYKGYLIQSSEVRKQIMTMAVGISVLSISKTNLSKVLIQLPSIEEQSKIASFLSAIDDKINGVSQQIEQTRQFKKGLLQQMFV